MEFQKYFAIIVMAVSLAVVGCNGGGGGVSLQKRIIKLTS